MPPHCSLKYLLLLLLLAMGWGRLMAQDSLQTDTLGRIEGRILDDEGNAVEGIVLRVMTARDSIVKDGSRTDSLGRYRILNLPMGNYVMRYSLLGYRPGFVDFNILPQRLAIAAPDIQIENSDVVLGAAVVTASLPPVTVIDDTVAYNADAFHAPEGSMVEDLIERIPGAEITNDGKIKINGKEYTQILIDGKEFFGNDPHAVLKNLPANIIKRIKTYDRKSERARLTGIDDGEEVNVLDLQIKPNMFKGWVGQVSGAEGNHDRYNSALNLNQFRKDRNFSLMGGMNNINNPSFSERGRDAMNYSRAGRPGLTASKGAGLSFSKEKKRKYRISANVRYNYSNAENQTSRNSTTEYSSTNLRFNSSDDHSIRRRDEINMNLNWEWHIDTLTTLQLRPNFSYSKTDNWSTGESHSSRWTDEETDTVNINERKSINNNNSEGSNENVSLTLHRRLSRKGRSITIDGSYSYSNYTSINLARNRINYFLQPKRNRNYSRFRDGNSFNMGYNWGLSYSEPIFNNTHLQLRYRYNYHHARSNNYGYEYDYLSSDTLLTDAQNINWNVMPIDTTLSSCNENTYVSQTIHVTMRHNLPKMNLSYGVNLNPRHNETNYIFGQKMDKGLIKQELMNWAPSLSFRYRFQKRTTLNLNYDGSSSDPNIDELQEIIDKSNPQNVRYGNPDLKPAFTNSMRGNFNIYGEKSHRSLVSNISYSTTSNSTSNMVFYESSTGVRVSKLMNVDGRWNLSGNINYNMPLDSVERLTLSTQSSANYNESTNYNSTPLSSEDLTSAGITGDFQDISPNEINLLQPYAICNHTHTLRLQQSMALRLRLKDYLFRLSGGINYYKVDNSVQKSNRRETFDYNLTAYAQMDLPFNIELSTTFNMTSRHGYSANIQKNIALWNAQFSKRFLKHNAGLITFQVFDILRQRSQVSRSINNLTITDTRSQSLRNYFLLGLQYRINTMGKQRYNRKNQQQKKTNQSNNAQRNQPKRLNLTTK